LTAAGNPAVATSAGRPLAGGRRLSLDWLGAVPFLAYVGLFLLLPSAIVGFGAFFNADSTFTLENFGHLSRSYVVRATIDTTVISAVTALAGAALGALLAYAIVTGSPNGLLRRLVVSASGVLAQFGGVTLAFAFIASIGPAGFVYLFAQAHGLDYYAHGIWLFERSGLGLVYLYFQIPLMVLVFLPALDGIKPQWREATESLGGNTWHYWRHIAGPILFPSFLGAALLLFANAFSAYATAQALTSGTIPLTSIQIGSFLSGNVIAGQGNVGKALGLGMVVIIAVVMACYILLQRRAAKWLR